MDKRSPLFLISAIAAISGWLAFWLVKTRYALLDDALIHLHYADLLHRYHFITYDGIHHSFGTSSLLYVSLLAFLRGFTASPLLPKAVSDLSYLIMIVVVVTLIVKLKGHLLSQVFVAQMLLCLISPMGIRWLTDGMETSLTNLLIICLALVTKAEEEHRSQSVVRYVLLAVFGATLVYLRIELAMIIALCSLAIALMKFSGEKSLAASLIEASPLSVGAVFALLSIRVTLGHFLPDTAVAKSGHLSLEPIFATVKVLGGALLLGLGTALCWAVSTFLTLRRVRQREQLRIVRICAVLLENAAIVIILALSCLRGQSIQGARYVIWPLFFGIVANAVQLAREDAGQTEVAGLDAMEKGFAVAFCLIFLCALPLDWRWATIAMRGRTQTFLRMRAAHFDRLFDGKNIIASDVGFITYFSNGKTCDMAGLVDGRKMAAMTTQERVAYCAQQSPAMLFVTSGQAHAIGEYIDLNNWDVCGIYDFTNVHSNDRHYLIVPADDAASVCSQLGSSPRPVADAVPKVG
jgi:hypothetical protein